MGRVRQRRLPYPEPEGWPVGKAAPFVVVMTLLLMLWVGFAGVVDGMIDWPVREEVIETRIYRAPAPSFSSALEPSKASEDSARLSNESDWAVWGGRFFTQTNGQPEGTSRQGFGVTNADDVEFWEAYKDLGGRRVLGFPLSKRFEYQGKVVQVLQRAVFQWDPGSKSVTFINVIDELTAHGMEGWLVQEFRVPTPLPGDFDRGKGWNEVVRTRLELLAADGIILGAYYSVPDPLTLYGLPTSRVEDRGTYNVVQLQRAIIQHWKPDADDPRAGQVTIIGAGEIAKGSGLFPSEAFVPEDPPPDDR